MPFLWTFLSLISHSHPFLVSEQLAKLFATVQKHKYIRYMPTSDHFFLHTQGPTKSWIPNSASQEDFLSPLSFRAAPQGGGLGQK